MSRQFHFIFVLGEGTCLFVCTFSFLHTCSHLLTLTQTSYTSVSKCTHMCVKKISTKTSHLMLIVTSSPLLQQQHADANTLTSSSPRQRATAPPPPPFDKIISIDKRRQTTGDGRGRPIGGRGGWRRGNGIHFGGWGESEEWQRR